MPGILLGGGTRHAEAQCERERGEDPGTLWNEAIYSRRLPGGGRKRADAM